MRVAIFGGSFDPPHVGHVEATRYLLGPADFERVLVVPVCEHAFDKALAPFAHRVALCRLAFGDIPDVLISEVEADLPKPNRTLATVRALRAAHPSWSFSLVVGADVLRETHRWHAFDEIVAIAPVFPLGRRGFETSDAPPPLLPEVSSTDIRERLAKGARAADLVDLAPPAVLDYAERHGLYAPARTS